MNYFVRITGIALLAVTVSYCGKKKEDQRPTEAEIEMKLAAFTECKDAGETSLSNVEVLTCGAFSLTGETNVEVLQKQKTKPLLLTKTVTLYKENAKEELRDRQVVATATFTMHREVAASFNQEQKAEQDASLEEQTGSEQEEVVVLEEPPAEDNTPQGYEIENLIRFYEKAELPDNEKNYVGLYLDGAALVEEFKTKSDNKDFGKLTKITFTFLPKPGDATQSIVIFEIPVK